jgi:hypothetical protein
VVGSGEGRYVVGSASHAGIDKPHKILSEFIVRIADDIGRESVSFVSIHDPILATSYLGQLS